MKFDREDELRAVLAAMQDVVLVFDSQGRYVSIATNDPSLLYEPASERIGKTVHEVLPKEQADVFSGCIRRASRTRRTVRTEYDLYIEGRRVSFTAVVSPMAEDRILWVARDITERKRAEESLKESEERFRQLFEQSADALLVHDETGRIVDCNHEACRSLGYSREEMLSLSVQDFAANLASDEEIPKGSGLWRQSAAQAFEKPIAGVHLAEHRRKDGTTFPVEVRVDFIDYGGKRRMLASIRDVTGVKRAAEALQESEERFRTLIQYSSEIISILEADGTVRYTSPSIERVLGYRPEERIGTRTFDDVHPEDAERVARAFTEALSRPGVTPPLEYRFRHSDGSWRYLETICNSLFDDPGVRGIVTTSRDITERKRSEGLLRQRSAALVASMDGMAILDEDGTYVYINDAHAKIYGYDSPEELLGKTWEAIYDKGELERLKRHVVPTLRECGRWRGEAVGRRRDGSTFPQEISLTAIKGGGQVCVVRDITERKQAVEALRESEQRFRQLFEQSVDAVFVHDEEGRFVDCNAQACLLLGYSREELLSLSVRDISCNILTEEERRRREREGGTLWQRALAAVPGTFVVGHEEKNRRKDGTIFPVEVRLGPVDYGGRRMILASVRDITERKALEDELTYRAFHDPLTGLPNRTLFLDHLERAVGRTQRGNNLVAVLFLDLDDFKVVNDSLRHEVGDQLLVAVGQRIKRCLRAGAVAARMGGDEFTVLLEDISEVGEAEEVAGRIIRELRAPFSIEGHLIFVTASIGIAVSDSVGGSSGELLRAADIALYRAKDTDKARYEVFDQSKDAHAFERLELENDLRKAIEREEFKVYYQPVFSLVSNYIAGMEALLRWDHPERGSMSPAEFIYLAEETGLIVPIGQWVLEKACRQAREWQELYPNDTPPIVGVNLSLRQFQHLGLAEDVARVLRETGLEPGNLALEITESVAMHDEDSTVVTLDKLKSLGVWLVIDDFGTGNSSLSYLTGRFKMDHLKIDGSFVREYLEDPDNSTIVPGLIDFAHAVGLRVIAEGVETAGQLRRLKEMGCEFVQGKHVAEPLTATAASELLSRFASGTSTNRDD